MARHSDVFVVEEELLAETAPPPKKIDYGPMPLHSCGNRISANFFLSRYECKCGATWTYKECWDVFRENTLIAAHHCLK
jgi:hypothetical protein